MKNLQRICRLSLLLFLGSCRFAGACVGSQAVCAKEDGTVTPVNTGLTSTACRGSRILGSYNSEITPVIGLVFRADCTFSTTHCSVSGSYDSNMTSSGGAAGDLVFKLSVATVAGATFSDCPAPQAAYNCTYSPGDGKRIYLTCRDAAGSGLIPYQGYFNLVTQ